MQTYKDCSTATVTAYDFASTYYEYIVTDSDLTVSYQNAASNDIHCYREYELWIKDADDGAASFVRYTSGATDDFLKTFDYTTNTDLGTFITFSLRTSD